MLEVIQRFLRRNITKNHSNVAHHGTLESRDVEANFLHGSHRAAGDDWDERVPNSGAESGAEERSREDDREHRFGSLNNVRERDCHLTETDARRNVTDGVKKRHGSDCHQKQLVDLRRRLHLGGPHGEHPNARCRELEC